MQELKQSTAIIIKMGVAVNSTGVTPVTTLAVSTADEAEILKNGTSATLAIAGTLTAITGADGWYNMTLSTGDTDTLGPLTVLIQDDSAILPIYKDFMVVDPTFYDAKYSTGPVKATLTSATYTTVTTFHASVANYSTFAPATDGVTLGSAVYTAIGDFHASVAAYSTFAPATDGVTLGAATYTTVTSFHASVAAYSTFDPSATGVTLTTAAIDGVHDEVVEGTLTFRQAQRLLLSVLTGKVSGGSTTTITFRDIGDTKDRLITTVDANGNRTAVGTRDGS